MKKELSERLWPFTLTVGVILLDQITKWLVSITVRPWTVGISLFGDFFRIIRVYNPGIAFSIGGSLSGNIRSVIFGLLPLFVIIIVIIVYFRSNELSKFQRWTVAGIIGGGLGNLWDRFFRPEGVLDFIDIKFFGIFGLERWPTFNLADSSVVVCGILLLFSLIFIHRDDKEVRDE